jgi:hypothetical protein
VGTLVAIWNSVMVDGGDHGSGSSDRLHDNSDGLELLPTVLGAVDLPIFATVTAWPSS